MRALAPRYVSTLSRQLGAMGRNVFKVPDKFMISCIHSLLMVPDVTVASLVCIVRMTANYIVIC